MPGRDLPGGLRIVEAAPRRRGLGLARLDDCRRRSRCTSSPCRSVHTFGMRFALDLIWLDRDGQRGPRRYGVGRGGCGPVWRARSVLEVRAGQRRRVRSAQRDGRDAAQHQD